MILAAGRGERMRPLTDLTPKPLLLAGGKPLIVWHIEKLAQAGFHQIVINHAYLGNQIETMLGNGSRYGISIRYSPEQEALETAGGIAQALHLLSEEHSNEAFLVVNGDTFCDYEYAQLQRSLPPGLLAWLVLVNNPEHNLSGDFALDGNNVRETGNDMLTFSGIGVYCPQLFAKVTPGSKAKLAPILRAAMAGQQVGGERFTGFWMDIGTQQRLHELDKMLSSAS
jgi:MurNAc alpha-1-phosphate uridylyltransferase